MMLISVVKRLTLCTTRRPLPWSFAGRDPTIPWITSLGRVLFALDIRDHQDQVLTKPSLTGPSSRLVSPPLSCSSLPPLSAPEPPSTLSAPASGLHSLFSSRRDSPPPSLVSTPPPSPPPPSPLSAPPPPGSPESNNTGSPVITKEQSFQEKVLAFMESQAKDISEIKVDMKEQKASMSKLEISIKNLETGQARHSAYLGSLHEFHARTVAISSEGNTFAGSRTIKSLEDSFLWFREICDVKHSDSVAAGTSRLACALSTDVQARMLESAWMALLNRPEISSKSKSFLIAHPWVDQNVLLTQHMDKCIRFLRHDSLLRPFASQLMKWKEPVTLDALGLDERGLGLALWSATKEAQFANLSLPPFPYEELELDLQGKILMLDNGVTSVRMGEIKSSASGVEKAIQQLCIRLAFAKWVIRAFHSSKSDDVRLEGNIYIPKDAYQKATREMQDAVAHLGPNLGIRFCLKIY